MRRGFASTDRPGNLICISSRKQRLAAVRAIVAYLERVRDAELRSVGAAAPGWRYESELIAAVIDEAVNVLETLY